MKLRRLFLVLLMATLCFGAMNVHAASGDIASGKSGALTWRIDANGKLTITGNGDYDERSWWDYSGQIITAEVSVTGITDMSYMFEDCFNLKSVRFTNCDTSKVKNMEGMFQYCENLTSVDFGGLNTKNVTNMSGMFACCYNLTSLSISGFNTENVTSMNGMFQDCESLKSLDLSSFNTENVTDMTAMFAYCNSLTTLDLSSFNTANVTDMWGMFYYCQGLTSLNLSSFNTGNVTNMSHMYFGCQGLTSLNLSSFNTGNVTDMSLMFARCNNLASLDLSHFNTEKVTDMSDLFRDCRSLTSLNLSSFNTQNVKYMNSTFYGCQSLTSLDLSGFNMQNVTKMSDMFYLCGNLKSLNLDNLNLKNVTWMAGMFFGCSKLTIDVTIGTYLSYESNYYETFANAATDGGHIRVYYTGKCTRAIAEKIVNTKSGDANVHLMDGLNDAIESPVPKTLTLTDSGLKFTWTAVEGVEKYRAYYKVNSGSWQKIVDTSGTNCTLPASEMSNGNIYSFTVKGISADGKNATTLYNKTGISYAYMKSGTDTVSVRNALIKGEFRLDFTPIKSVEEYDIYYKEQNDKVFQYCGYSTQAYAYVQQEAVSGKTYVFRVVPHGLTVSCGGYKDASVKCLYSIASYDMTLANGLKGAKVSWNKVDGAEGYYIYRRTPEGSYEKIGAVKGVNSLTYTDGTAKSGSTYYYSVRAYSGSTLSSYQGKSIKFLSPIIASDLTLTNTRNGARIAWNKVTGAEGYYVYRRTPEGSYKKIGTVKGNTSCAYTDRTAANGATYLYCVRAYSGSTLGNYAGKTTVRLSTTDIAALLREASGDITLSWDLNSKANGYQVQYSEDASFASGTFTTVKIESAETDSTTITGLTAGKTYYVRMRSYKTVGKANYYAGWSTIVKAE